MANQTPCLLCPAVAKTRGLCTGHYDIARDLVRRGVVTWEILVAKNKALPGRTYQTGKSANDFFSDEELAELKKSGVVPPPPRMPPPPPMTQNDKPLI